MKHLLNNMSESEKRAIREQHEGGMVVGTSRFKKLLEATIGNVKPLILEENPPAGATPVTNTGTGPKPTVSTNQEDSWVKVIAFSDPETTQAMTNIEIDPHMIGLEGNDVKFTYKVAGKTGNGTGIFNCNSKNEMHFDGKPLTGTMYISDKRVDTLKSKCGANQGYASTGGGSNQNMAESRRTHKRTINEMEGFEDDIQAANDWRAANERRASEREQERLSRQRKNDDEMFDMEMRKLEMALYDIKRSTNDPDTLNHIVDMIISVSLPRIKDFR